MPIPPFDQISELRTLPRARARFGIFWLVVRVCPGETMDKQKLVWLVDKDQDEFGRAYMRETAPVDNGQPANAVMTSLYESELDYA